MITKMEINVIKRNGQKEPLNYEKINKVLLWAVEGLSGVSASQIAMNAQLQFYNGIKTNDIHSVLIQSAVELISETEPNYQLVASNLLNFFIRKNIFDTFDKMPHVKDIMTNNVKKGIYDPLLLTSFTNEELDKINSFIKHERDFNFTWAGLQQLVDKYLLKDRISGEIYETPQYMYIFIAMTLFADYKGDKISMIKTFYNLISKWKISLPTPIMCGVRTPNRQYSSCTLIDVGDSLESIYASNTAVGYYTSKRAGIGLNVGRIRAIGSSIRGGEVVHTGVIPFLKMFESTTRSCTQNGVRGGSSTTYFPFWHREVEDVLVLKNNKGTDDNRVRKMDYGIQFCRLFYKRFIANETITLFSPHEVKDLYDAFGYNERFEELYEKYEKDPKVSKKVIKARDLINQFCQERIGTGRIYVMNIDHANEHSAFQDKVHMSNLCLKGDTMIPVKIEIDENLTEVLTKYELTYNNGIYEGNMKIEDITSLFNLIYIESYNIDNNVVMRALGKIEVLSFNIEKNIEEYKPVLKAMMTKKLSNCIKITDEDSGLVLYCTKEHPIYTTNRGYVKAIELKENDILLLAQKIKNSELLLF
ncbi:MAG: Synechococcus phage [Bacteroidota bacterium]|jgi:ribonucleoside-diphosphate reductase alpha chain